MKKVEIRKDTRVDRYGKDVSVVIASRFFENLEAGIRWAKNVISRNKDRDLLWVAVDGKEVMDK
jgi:hypothetical protein